MPIYEYKCQSCDYKFEILVKSNDLQINKIGTQCPQCGYIADKMVSKPSTIIWKTNCPTSSRGKCVK